MPTTSDRRLPVSLATVRTVGSSADLVARMIHSSSPRGHSSPDMPRRVIGRTICGRVRHRPPAGGRAGPGWPTAQTPTFPNDRENMGEERNTACNRGRRSVFEPFVTQLLQVRAAYPVDGANGQPGRTLDARNRLFARPPLYCRRHHDQVAVQCLGKDRCRFTAELAAGPAFHGSEGGALRPGSIPYLRPCRRPAPRRRAGRPPYCPIPRPGRSRALQQYQMTRRSVSNDAPRYTIAIVA